MSNPIHDEYVIKRLEAEVEWLRRSAAAWEKACYDMQQYADFEYPWVLPSMEIAKEIADERISYGNESKSEQATEGDDAAEDDRSP